MKLNDPATIKNGSYRTTGTITKIDTVLRIVWVRTKLPWEKLFDLDSLEEVGGGNGRLEVK